MDTAASRSIDLVFQAYNTALKAQETLAKVLLMSLEFAERRNDDRSEIRTLKKYLNGNRRGADGMRVVTCPADQVKKLSEELSRNGVVNTYGSYTFKTHDKGNSYVSPVGMIIFRDMDEKKAEKITAWMNTQELSAGLSTKPVINQESGGNMRKVTGLSMEEAMLFAEHASEMGIHVAVENPDPDKYNVVYDGEHNRDTIEQIKARVAVDLMGKSGEELKKQLQYEDKNVQKITDGILNNTLVPKNGKPVHIVDYDGATLHVERGKVQYESQDGVHTYGLQRPHKGEKQETKHFQECVIATIANMRGAVMLSDAQYQAYLNAETREERKKILQQADRENGRPVFSQEGFKDKKIKEANRSLYEQKLMQDNPVQTADQHSFTNDEIRMGEFFDKEKFNKDIQHDKTEGQENPNPSFDNDAFAQDADFDTAQEAFARYQDDDKEEEIDFEQEQKNEQALSGQREERAEEREDEAEERFEDYDRMNKDNYHDINGNWQEDGYETPDPRRP